MTEDTSTGGDTVSRRSVLGASAGLAMAGLAGCGGGDTTTEAPADTDTTTESSEPTPNDTELEVLHAWTGGDGAAAVEKLTSMFKEEYPDLATNFRPIGGTGNVNLDSVVARRLANRDPPAAWQAWPGQNITQYGGLLANITDVWEENNYTETMNSRAATESQLNGEYRSMPLVSHRMNNLFYNVHVFDDAGVDPSAIDNPNDLLDAFETIGQETDADPMAHAMSGAWTTLQLVFQNFLGMDGGYDAYMNYIEGDVDEDHLRNALEVTKEMLENHINSDAATIAFTEGNQQMMDGNAGCIQQGNWAYGMYRAEDSGVSYQEDWDWIAYPGTSDMYMLHIDAFTFARDTNTPVKQKMWAKFLGTKDAQVEFGNRKGAIPLRTDIDSSRLTPFLEMNADHLANKEKFPPTIAHGLAVSPEQLSEAKDVIGSNFMGPYNVDQTVSGLTDVVSQ
ncbi:carbohydrate ABC transporter substrate-binding protein [Halorhabdus sp. CBA1104]|uniref:ABC transporter substrate-binding protein n=1 Tax=unclassified Halorhabdus TaxID=2621901 RepID=UPI0012B28D78|nr:MULTISPECIES: ABC transporter substrate-binding protein [unclassified Halorhabdus]QGN07245.1 carbohydrate ABC transporter substrate-binding protein [Halorhabdus sp. CBA1104]